MRSWAPLRLLLRSPWSLVFLWCGPRRAAGLAPAATGARFHHTAVRTVDVERALEFYSLLGLEEEARFRSGAARCAWLRGLGARLELIEVPPAVGAGRAPDGLAATAVGAEPARASRARARAEWRPAPQA